jgi:hypothetical protein
VKSEDYAGRTLMVEINSSRIWLVAAPGCSSRVRSAATMDCVRCLYCRREGHTSAHGVGTTVPVERTGKRGRKGLIGRYKGPRGYHLCPF